MGKKRLLIIDDDKNLLHVLKDALVYTGNYLVEAVSDPVIALKAARIFKPDLVILDVMMPDMDGGQVAEAIWGDDALRNVPIIFQTAVLSKDEAAKRHSYREHYMAKPVPLAELIEKIEELCG